MKKKIIVFGGGNGSAITLSALKQTFSKAVILGVYFFVTLSKSNISRFLRQFNSFIYYSNLISASMNSSRFPSNILSGF